MKERNRDDEIEKLRKAIFFKVGREGSDTGAGTRRISPIREDVWVEEGSAGRGNSTGSGLEGGGSLPIRGLGRRSEEVKDKGPRRVYIQ